VVGLVIGGGGEVPSRRDIAAGKAFACRNVGVGVESSPDTN
jgi:hypothetical protein